MGHNVEMWLTDTHVCVYIYIYIPTLHFTLLYHHIMMS